MQQHDERIPGAADMADADLVLRTRSGDSDAFGELWRRHYRSGLTVARSVTGSFDPDDLVQEAYARIYQSIINGGGPTGSFRAYLFTSIRNTAAAWGRGRKESNIDEFDLVEDPDTTEAATDEALDRSLTHSAFRSLPSRWQEVLWYTEIEQMKPAEIAPLLGMTATAVAQLSFRAREGLREAWIQAHLRSVEDGSECQWTIQRMGAYARGNVGKRDLRRFEAHLADCARCAIVVAEAKDVSNRLALILLPLTVGAGAATAYLATVQGATVPLTAMAAGEGGVYAGTTATAGAGSVSAMSSTVGGAGGSGATGGAAGAAGGSSSVSTMLGVVAASVLVAAGALTAAVVIPRISDTPPPLANSAAASESSDNNESLDVAEIEQPEEGDTAELVEDEAPEEQAPEEQTPEEQTPEEHAPEEHAPEEHAPEEHAPEEHAPEEQAPEEQAPEQDAPEESAPEEDEAPAEPEPTTPVEDTSDDAAENPAEDGATDDGATEDDGDDSGAEDGDDSGAEDGDDSGAEPTPPGDGDGEGDGDGDTEEGATLPDGSPEFTGGTYSLPSGLTRLSVLGAPDVLVRAVVNGETRGEDVRTDENGEATLEFVVPWDELTSTVAEVKYVSDDGEESEESTRVSLNDAPEFDLIADGTTPEEDDAATAEDNATAAEDDAAPEETTDSAETAAPTEESDDASTSDETGLSDTSDTADDTESTTDTEASTEADSTTESQSVETAEPEATESDAGTTTESDASESESTTESTTESTPED